MGVSLVNFGGNSMVHKGVKYTITKTELPGIWKWQFRIGDLVRSGKTEARLRLLAMRRVQLRIDRELKHGGVRKGTAVS
jgi:hypothetical protein